MGIEYTRIHLEKSSALIHQLPINDVVPNRFGPIYDNQSRNLTDIHQLKKKKKNTSKRTFTSQW